MKSCFVAWASLMAAMAGHATHLHEQGLGHPLGAVLGEHMGDLVAHTTASLVCPWVRGRIPV